MCIKACSQLCNACRSTHSTWARYFKIIENFIILIIIKVYLLIQCFACSPWAWYFNIIFIILIYDHKIEPSHTNFSHAVAMLSRGDFPTTRGPLQQPKATPNFSTMHEQNQARLIILLHRDLPFTWKALHRSNKIIKLNSTFTFNQSSSSLIYCFFSTDWSSKKGGGLPLLLPLLARALFRVGLFDFEAQEFFETRTIEGGGSKWFRNGRIWFVVARSLAKESVAAEFCGRQIWGWYTKRGLKISIEPCK